ncbi:MAG: hypothetical protein WD034_09255 [Parvibaculum sp.]
MVASVVCLGLAACGTDKISMSSEVGGGSTSRVFAAGAGGSNGGSAPGGGGPIPGGGASPGLGVTGDGGVLDNVIGADPVGGFVDNLLGSDNPISAITGSGSGTGLVPSLAGALAGDPDAEVTGLGLAGDGGLVADLTGADMLGGLLDSNGVVGASIAGGDDGLMGALLNSQAAYPPLAPVAGPLAAALPSSALEDPLSSLPVLGISGSDGLVADLAGTDIVGNLVGTSAPAGGGNEGLLGNLVPAGDAAPLAPVGDAVTGVLNVIAGNDPSPLAGPGDQLGVLPVLDGILGTGTESIGDALSPLTGALGAASPQAGSAPTPTEPTGPLAPVTGAIGGLPVVGGLLGGS